MRFKDQFACAAARYYNNASIGLDILFERWDQENDPEYLERLRRAALFIVALANSPETYPLPALPDLGPRLGVPMVPAAKVESRLPSDIPF